MAAPGVARLNSNGTLDGTFNATGFTRFSFDRPIRGVVVQVDGKIHYRRPNSTLPAAPRTCPLVRLNSNGSLDPNPTFILRSTSFESAIWYLQPDGKPVALEHLRSIVSTSMAQWIRRFSQPVLVDTSALQAPEGFTLNLQSDGRILIGGLFNEGDESDGT